MSKAMAKPKKKRKSVALTLAEFRLKDLKREFNEQAKMFQTMMDPHRGGGIYCVQMLDCLRALNTLYLNVAAHSYVVDSLKTGV